MILRARVKLLEDMPPGAICCAHMRRQLVGFGAREISVSASAKLKRCHCQGCGAKFIGMRVAGMRGWRIDPRCWEIEEAPEEIHAD